MRALTYIIIGLFVVSCQRGKVNEYEAYLNHHDTVKYVGKETCKQCHYDIYTSFMHTGMGKSVSFPVREESALPDSPPIIFDEDKNLYYQPFWKKDSLWIHEFRLNKKDTIHSFKQKVNYIIGSGHHTNSHLFEINGYVHQLPYTYYTQKEVADLPPGFEDGNNTRFSRRIDMECMSCHNGYADYVSGSINQFNSIPTGIDCERCHGPGEAHVNEKKKGILVDTSKHIDYSIVNPSNLSLDLQFDICQRCHLQGTAVLSPDKDWDDFKPGEHLSDVMDIYLPKYTNDESFIMASHADRLKQSSCFKNADISCISCHNPHQSVQELPRAYFDNKCMDCHNTCEEEDNRSDCISCHMPKSSSIDIPHVTITDHKIGIHDSKDYNKGDFLGLFCINNETPSDLSKAKAYLKQYESFAENPIYLDSAKLYLSKVKDNEESFDAFIEYYYLKKEFNSLINYAVQFNVQDISISEESPLSFARIGESFSILDLPSESIKYYRLARKHASSNLEYRLKLGVLYMKLNKVDSAQIIFNKIILDYPYYKEALVNLAYIDILEKKYIDAEIKLNRAIKLDPDYLLAYENMIILYLAQNNSSLAKKYLNKILEIYPSYKIPRALQNKIF